MIREMRENINNKNVNGAIYAAKKAYENGEWSLILAELIVAASEEVNWNNLHQPIGLLVMRTVAQSLEKSNKKWVILESVIRFVCNLERIPPGPTPILPSSIHKKDWDLTRLTVELLRIVRKSNYYKVYSILVSIENEELLFKSMYAVASVVPGPRGYNMILVQCLQDLYAYLNEDQKRQVLLAVVEMFNNLVQSSRYTTTLLYLVGLNQLNEYLVKEPKQTYGDRLMNWMENSSANEIYWNLQQKKYSDDEILNACRQMTIIAPGLNGINVLQTLAFSTAYENCRDSFYFNKRNMRSYLIREVTNKQARSVRIISQMSSENAHVFLSLSLDYLLVLNDADLMKVAVVVSQESENYQQELFTSWMEAGLSCEIKGLRPVVLYGYLEAAKQSDSNTKAMFIFRALQELQEIRSKSVPPKVLMDPLV